MSVGMAQLAAGLLVGLGLLGIGVFIGLGVREDREADRAARIALARLEARRAAWTPKRLIPAPAAEAPAWYLPGYADPFPRPGRFPADLGQLAGYRTGVPDWAAPETPHGPASRPITSPVDLDGAVRLMCIETADYVDRLIAGTYHAEGNPN